MSFVLDQKAKHFVVSVFTVLSITGW